jgi:hypothetical protein
MARSSIVIIIKIAVYNFFGDKFSGVNKKNTAYESKQGIEARYGVPPVAVVITQKHIF